VVARPAQIVDVTLELEVGELGRLARLEDLLLEITRLLRKIEACALDPPEPGVRRAEVAHPTTFERPAARGVDPGALRVHAPQDRLALQVDLDDVQSHEDLPPGIVVVVVEDAVRLAEDPLALRA